MCIMSCPVGVGMKPVRLPQVYLIRHCKTLWGPTHLLKGTLDVPLSDVGREQAKGICPRIEELGINRVVTSPLRRAHETAEIYAKCASVPLQVNLGFIELDHGDWQGKSFDELLSNSESRYKQWLEDPTAVPIPGGSETVQMAQSRVFVTLRGLVQRYSNERILIVTHKHIRAILQCALKGLALSSFGSQIDDSLEPLEIPIEYIQSMMRTKQRISGDSKDQTTVIVEERSI